MTTDGDIPDLPHEAVEAGADGRATSVYSFYSSWVVSAYEPHSLVASILYISSGVDECRHCHSSSGWPSYSCACCQLEGSHITDQRSFRSGACFHRLPQRTGWDPIFDKQVARLHGLLFGHEPLGAGVKP